MKTIHQFMSKWAPVVGFSAVVCLLSACSGSQSVKKDTPQQEVSTGVTEPVRQPSTVQPTVAEPTDKAAVSILWNKAEKSRKSGDVEGAYAQLEQAVKIQPKSPVLWSRMAELKLKQRQFVSAENLAAKSNQLVAGRNKVLEYRNWLIIAKAREANGNYAGAAQASERAKALRP